jgi:hypothetical protein
LSPAVPGRAPAMAFKATLASSPANNGLGAALGRLDGHAYRPFVMGWLIDHHAETESGADHHRDHDQHCYDPRYFVIYHYLASAFASSSAARRLAGPRRVPITRATAFRSLRFVSEGCRVFTPAARCRLLLQRFPRFVRPKREEEERDKRVATRLPSRMQPFNLRLSLVGNPNQGRWRALRVM